MANQEHLDLLKRSVAAWKRWRAANPTVVPDLRGANLRDAQLSYADLQGANLRGLDLRRAHLSYADLQRADLLGADLNYADLQSADLLGADLDYADLQWAHLQGAGLRGADLHKVTLGFTTFGDNDLSAVKGLETVRHRGPSTIGIDMLYKSGGKLPTVFLRGCGLPDSFIEYIPLLIGAMQPVQYFSCFISYSTKDDDFARRLHERMRAEHLRVWFAPEEMQGGKKLYDQIDRAIQLHDRLLLVLSDHSMHSEWVLTEILRARDVERREHRQKLFPIRLVDMDAITTWRYVDPDSGKDVGREVREYFIPDFSHWKEHDAFESAFARLLRALRAAEQVSSQV